MIRRLGLLALVACIGSCSLDNDRSASTTFETENTLAGRAVDSIGRPVAGATIVLRPYWYVREGDSARIDPHAGSANLVTDARGFFQMTGLPPGDYRIEARSRGTACLIAVRVLPENRQAVVGDIPLGRTASLSGSVIGATRPAIVRIYGAERFVWTDSSGRYRFDSLPEGILRLSARDGVSGMVVGEAEASLQAGHPLAGVELHPGTEDPSTWRHGEELLLSGLATTAGDSPVADLPLLLSLDGSRFPSSSWGGGADLRVQDGLGSALPFEVVVFDSIARRCRLWIRLDSLASPRSVLPVSVRWGRPGAPSRSASSAVFDTARGWSAVWHLARVVRDAQGRLRSPDATRWGMDLVVSGRGLGSDGPAGGGHAFDGSTDLLRAGGGSTNLGKRPYLLQMWVKSERVGGSLLVKGKDFYQAGMKELALRTENQAHVPGWTPVLSSYGTFANYAFGKQAVAPGAWSHLTLRWTPVGTDSAQTDWFLDGEPVATGRRTPSVDDPLADDSISLGAPVGDTPDSLRLRGGLDEVRILREFRSDAWIRATRAAQSPDLWSILRRW